MVFAGQDAWRKHPMLTNCYKRPFPGFGIALGIFTGYCILDGAVKFVAPPAAKSYAPGTFKFQEQFGDDEDDDE
ncbi:unnamed protein product [Pylaiella littoralis]